MDALQPDALHWDAHRSAHPPDSDPTQADPEIRPLVEAINRTNWMETLQSCAGHPERGKPYFDAPWVWVLLRDPQSLPRFFLWVEQATFMRQQRSVNKADRLIDVYFLGWYTFGVYFMVRGRYIDAAENVLIREALREALLD